MKTSIKKAVIPAAGWGTRILPASKVVPKELLPIVDRPSIQLIIEEGIQAGIEEFILVVSPEKEEVLKHFQAQPELEKILIQKGKHDLLEKITSLQEKAEFKLVYQNEAKGLGHAVLCAEEMIGDNWFFVFLPDDIVDHSIGCTSQMLNAFQENPGAQIAVMEVPWEEVHQYGVVKASPLSDHLGKVEAVVEKPSREDAPSNLSIIGRYLLPPQIFSHIKNTAPGAVGEIQLTDALGPLCKDPGLFALQFLGERFDVGQKLGFLQANIHFGLKDEEIKDKLQEFIKLIQIEN